METPFWGNLNTGLKRNSNALIGLGSGLLAGDNFARGLAMGGQGWSSGADQDFKQFEYQQQQDQELDTLNKTTEWLRQNGHSNLLAAVESGAMTPGEAWKTALNPPSADSNLMSVGGHIYDTASGQWISPPQDASATGQRVSLSGQWGRDEQGNPVYLQPSDTGELIPARPPEGVSLMGPFDISADRSAGGVFGKGVGGAQFDLPSAKLIGQQTVQAINDVRAEKAGMAEHFGNFAGVPQQLLPALPKSEKAQFQVAADRAINRAFLEGREMLKGGGQITDFESRKAEAAITAAQSALEKGDQAQFLKALDDFEKAVGDGLVKLEGQTRMMPGYGSGGAQGGNSGGWTVIGVDQ